MFLQDEFFGAIDSSSAQKNLPDDPAPPSLDEILAEVSSDPDSDDEMCDELVDQELNLQPKEQNSQELNQVDVDRSNSQPPAVCKFYLRNSTYNFCFVLKAPAAIDGVINGENQVEGAVIEATPELVPDPMEISQSPVCKLINFFFLS